MGQVKRIKLGQVYGTKRVMQLIPEEALAMYLTRHLFCDWGDVCDEDQRANEQALETGDRLLSAYVVPDVGRIYIITDAENDECERVSSTVMFCDEY